jgi:hypothetical protein
MAMRKLPKVLTDEELRDLLRQVNVTGKTGIAKCRFPIMPARRWKRGWPSAAIWGSATAASSAP